MRTLKIRDDIFRRLKEIADQRHVPVDRQAEEFLWESIEFRERPDDVRDRIEAVAAMTPNAVNQTDAVTMLRQDRDR